MINWSRGKTLLAGLGLLVITNAVALLGAAWNRSGAPESELQLTQRELQVPYWGISRESSGVSLNLLWRTLPADTKDPGYPGSGGAPHWLDRDKLQSLGFDMTGLVGRAKADARRERPLSQSVLLVLELNGPAYQESLARMRRYALEAEARYAAAPGSDDLKRQSEGARNSASRAENEGTRLFVVDAGTELSALRAKYPDRQHYAIVHGQVRPWVHDSDNGIKIEGFVDQISNANVNVPYAYRAAFVGENRMTRNGAAGPNAPVAATIAFGKRLEPWVVALSVSAPARPVQ